MFIDIGFWDIAFWSQKAFGSLDEQFPVLFFAFWFVF